MIDQAQMLRTLVRDDRAVRRSDVFVLAVTSGKGGVGKTSVAVNLAVLLARAGRLVRLVDADFGLSNAEVMLGVKPRHTLRDVLTGGVDIQRAWADGPHGLKLLSSGSGLHEMADIGDAAGTALIDYVLCSASTGDVVIVDTSPGIDGSVMSLLPCADEIALVTTPEPTSITDSYAAMKVLLSRVPDADVTLVANCCANPAQASSVAKGLHGICMAFLGKSFGRFEHLPCDDAVSRAVRAQKPVVDCSPRASASIWLRRAAIKLDDRIRRHAHAEMVVA